jgi:DNA-binding LacI/PurR family transcriptional regulator
MKKKIRTMEELAEAIAVSRPTLSRFFQDPSRVRASTRARIEAGLAKVDYVPNFFAINMNRKSTRLIGVIVPYLNDLLFTSLIQAIEFEALARDYMILTQSSHGDPALEVRAAENLRSMNADGVIVAPLGEESSRAALERLTADLPVVFIDSRLPGGLETADFAGTNNEHSISLMVDYLCRSGPPPAFLGMPRVNLNSIAREEVYCARMRALGHEPQVIAGDPGYHGWDFEQYGYELMSREFASGRHMGATVLCANDRLAIGVIKAANRHHLFAAPGGGRFRVAGHDDHPLASYVFPSLTTVSQDVEAIAGAALSLLVDRITGRVEPAEKSRIRLFDARLILRDSA